jgi:hypothetical protein
MLKWDLFGDKFRESWGFFWLNKQVYVRGSLESLIDIFEKEYLKIIKYGFP